MVTEDPWLTDTDLAVLARLIDAQVQANTWSGPSPVSVHRVELQVGIDAEGRRFLTRDPVAAASAEVLRPAGTQTQTNQQAPRTTLETLIPEPTPPPPLTRAERWRGSLFAGAMGDALGAPIEADPIDRIRERTTPAGLVDLIPAYEGLGTITDDTQMTLFTCDALIRAHAAWRRGQQVDTRYLLQQAYQRWLHTQGAEWRTARGPAERSEQPDGWLIGVRGLFHRRAPGATCFFALKEYAKTGEMGTFTHSVNNSKGCGGVMRAAPAALWSDDPAAVFELGAVSAALTHSHPSGYLSAGAFAVILQQLLRGVPLPDAIDLAKKLLVGWPGHEEQLTSLDQAIDLAGQGAPTPEKVETLGAGNVGETALAIGIYSALATTDVNSALLTSVNHSGDSDSTGAVCGNLVGAMYGERAIRADWLSRLELREVIGRLADDALAEFGPNPPVDDQWVVRYPPH